MLLHILRRSLPVLVIGSVLMASDDEPGRGVARLSLLQGDVSVRRGDSGDWVAAAPNAPLVVEDRVLTGVNSRAEVQMDYANLLRLAASSEVRFAELEYNRYIIQVAAGTVTYRVLRNSESEVEISTPSVAVRPVKRGVYRVTVLPDGTSEVTVRSGEVEIFTPRGTERLKSGRTMVARGSTSDPEFQMMPEIPEDDFDRWSERRDRDLERSNSYRYVSTSVYGAEDLDHHGTWVNDPPYGWVWVPNVAAGWAPYRYGRWSWVDWYGWSWISYDPWGWAPYHYGRWYQGPRGWCWWPGVVRSRHYWSPGLVAFVGYGSYGGFRAGIGFGWGNVGWIPLAPYEPYHRGYGWNHYRGYRNRTYVDNSVNIVNNINITNVYRNARVRDGITGLSANDFAGGRAGNVVRLSGRDLNGAGVVRGQLPLAPDRGSLRLADRDVGTVSRSANEGRFFSRRSPSPVERVSFDDQRRGVEEISRRAFAGDRAGDRERGAGTFTGRAENDSTGRRAEGPGWRRAGEPATETGPRAVERSEQRGNWRRFGEPRETGPSGQSFDTGSDSSGRNRTVERSRDSGWRRFGESGNSSGNAAPSPSGGEVRDGSRNRGSEGGRTGAGRDSSWRRFGEPGESGSGDRNVWRGAEGRREPVSPRTEGSRWGGMRSGDRGGDSGSPVRVNPPMVRERAEPRSVDRGSFDRGGFGRGGSDRGGFDRGGFDRGNRSSGSEQRAPRMEGGGMRGGGGMSAPRMEGGRNGGGGGNPGGRGGGRQR